MGDMVESKEHSKIEKIEEMVCKLANDVGNALTQANKINRFFFGVPIDEKSKKEAEAPALTGWFEGHMVVIGKINDKVLAIQDALRNIRDVVHK